MPNERAWFLFSPFASFTPISRPLTLLFRMKQPQNQSPFRHVLLTGASSGIGVAAAVRFAELGTAHLYFCGRDAARLDAAAEQVRTASQGRTQPHPCVLDVQDRAATRAWIERCDAETPLDLVWANAGVSTGGCEDDEEAVRQVFSVNLDGVLNTLYPAIDCFRRTERDRFARRLAITSSMTGYHGMPQCPAYSASKACVKALGSALRGRLRSAKICVTTICPGFVRSRITDQNTCPMPFFMEAPAAARIIVDGIARGRGLISFPWPMRFGMWLLSTMPEALSERLFACLPEKR